MQPKPPETEVHFCNICNTSIPESALQSGCAVRVEGRILPTAGPGALAAEPGRVGRAGVFGAAFLALLGIAAAAVFLDWRLSETAAGLRTGLDDSGAWVARLDERLALLEERLGAVARAGQLTPLESELRGLGEQLRASAAMGDERFAAASRANVEAKEQMQRLADAQVQQAARLALLQDDLRALGHDVAELRAQPMKVADTPRDDGMEASRTPPADAPPAGFTPAIQHHLDRLGDADESVRFEAVQELLAAGDPRVLPRIVPLAKDADFFVRRLVLEGLAKHRSAEHVEVLLTALADPESLVRHSAYQGLKELTGQSLPFDADASAEQRGAMQKRWRAWWDKAKDGF